MGHRDDNNFIKGDFKVMRDEESSLLPLEALAVEYFNS